MRLLVPLAELPPLTLLAEPSTYSATQEELDAMERGELDPTRKAEITACARSAFHRLMAMEPQGSC